MPDSSANSPLLGDDRWLAGRELVTLRGNQPWPLTDGDRCWAIVEGAVDVFSVHVGEDGEMGARRHVTVAGPGQLLSGGALAAAEDGRAVTLLAVPSTTAGVVTLSRAEVRELLDDPVERLLMTLAITDWAETLSIGAARGAAPVQRRRRHTGRPPGPVTPARPCSPAAAPRASA